MDISSILSQRINLSGIRRVAAFCAGDEGNCECLWRLIHSDTRIVSVNALWVLTHFDAYECTWIENRREELTDMLLSAADAAKKRMLLKLLRNMDYRPDNIRTDLLDFCMSKIDSECESYAVRAFSIHVAFKICRLYPELLAELKERLEMLKSLPLSPGLASALRQTEKKISML